MQDLMAMMASIMSKDMMLEMMEMDIQKYKECMLLNKQVEADKVFSSICAMCAMLLMKSKIGDSIEEAEKLSEDMRRHMEIKDMFKPKN